MKNKTKFTHKLANIGKVVLVAGLLSSCGNESPIIGGTKPFIISEITPFNETHVKYWGTENSSTCHVIFGGWNSYIVLPKKLYNIGDTIKLDKPCH